eukprot:COSAG01_NODE_1433_length_10317_cov_590.337366_8_plen_98_part_00
MSDAAASDFDLDKTCRLAHLEIDDNETTAFKAQIEAILHDVSTLNKLDLDHLEPSSHASDAPSSLRKDEPIINNDLKPEQNAPDWQDHAFWVPKIKA